MKISEIMAISMYKAYAELKVEITRSYIGIFWWILEPLLYLGAFFLLFEVIFHRGGEGYVFKLLTGLVLWKWFSSSVLSSVLSIYANRMLIQQIYIHKSVFPLTVILANIPKFAIIFTLLIVFLLLSGYEITAVWLYLPLLVVAQFLLTLGLSLLVATLVPFLPDLKIMIDNLMMLGLFMSGVFFDITTLSEKLQFYFYMNPMCVLIESFKRVLLYDALPPLGWVIYVVAFSGVTILLAVTLLLKFDRKYVKYIR